MLNLSQFIVYSLWFGYISNAIWVLNTQVLPPTGEIFFGITCLLAVGGWVINFGALLLVEFGRKD